MHVTVLRCGRINIYPPPQTKNAFLGNRDSCGCDDGGCDDDNYDENVGDGNDVIFLEWLDTT